MASFPQKIYMKLFCQVHYEEIEVLSIDKLVKEIEELKRRITTLEAQMAGEKGAN